MTIRHYHPVSLTVIRASLIAQGFELMRIKTISPAMDGAPWADYRITIGAIVGRIPQRVSPADIKQAANAAFASDIHVKDVEYRGGFWNIIIRSHTEYDHEFPTAGEPETTLQEVD